MSELFTPHVDIVDEIVGQLEPLVARQRKSLVEAGCFRHISSTHLHVLYMLATSGRMPMSRLAEQLDVSLPNVTGIVERMVERGMVERSRPEDDRRVVEVRICPSGRALLDEIDMVKRQQMANVINRLSPEQQERALRTFTELRIATEELTREEESQRVPAQSQGEVTN
jgi:DNA-binding MarR family transcriptional regulator